MLTCTKRFPPESHPNHIGVLGGGAPTCSVSSTAPTSPLRRAMTKWINYEEGLQPIANQQPED